MISLRERIQKQLAEKKGFGNLVDVCNSILFSQIIYCALLTIYYLTYQGGKTEFQPVVYFFIMILVVACIGFESLLVEHWKLAVLELASLALLCILVPIGRGKLWFVLGCVVFCARSLFQFRYRFSSSASYADRYRSNNRDGISIFIIAVLFFVHAFTSDKMGQAAISPLVCTHYMLASFALFMVALIMKKYAFKYYEYYRQELQQEDGSSQQLKRSFVLILLTTVVIMALIFLIFGDLLIPVLNGLLNLLSRLFFGLLYSLFQVDLRPNVKLHTNPSSETSVGQQPVKVTRTESPIASLVPMLVIMILILAALYLVWKLYKTFLSNYKVESDQVEFVSGKRKTGYEKYEKKRTKALFGKTNEDKVRRWYYLSVERLRRKNNRSFDLTKTPEEITKLVSVTPREKEIMEDLLVSYEKARYSGEELKDEEVENVRQRAGKLSRMT